MPEDQRPRSSALSRIFIPRLNINPPNSPPSIYADAVAHFRSIPWCAALLDAPNVTPFIPSCRNPGSELQDQFLGATLASERGLQHMLCFFRSDGNLKLRSPAHPVTEVSTLFALGDGLSGFTSILHGGMTMSMVDEAMSAIIELNAALGKDGVAYQTGSVTATLEIKFLKPIRCPGIVLATAQVDAVEDRKTRIRCRVTDEDGVELARVASIWISIRAKV